MGFTRTRDLAAIALIAAVCAYLLVRLNYGRMPALPRLAGLAAALVGLGEAAAGFGLRARIRDAARGPAALRPRGAGMARRPPVPPLTAARAVMVAKATSLAGAALGGLWVGLLAHVAPAAADLPAAGADTVTGWIGLTGAVIMTAGALYLEHCCRAPDEPDIPPGRPA